MKASTPIGLLTEKEWSTQVSDLARMLGWRRYHTFRSERSQPGFPDETLVRDRIVFLELKTETGKVSPAQRDWLTAILAAGGEAYIVRPRDLEVLAGVLSYQLDDDLVTACLLELAGTTRGELGQPP